MQIEKIYRFLPSRITFAIRAQNRKILENVNEIRLRTNLPVSLTLPDRNIILAEPILGQLICTKEEIAETLSYLCSSSLYSFDETIKNGYIPLDNGGRAGVCGDAVCDKNGIRAFGKIYSINIRIPRFFPDFAFNLFKYYKENSLVGTLVFSPPSCGKTTYLKSLIYLMSKEYRVCVADEKGELFADSDKYTLADGITSCKKQTAIDLLTKTMSPQIIVCDEITSAESDGIIAAQNSGVYLVASCHGESRDGVLKRPFINDLYQKGVFSLFVKLFYDNGYKSEIIKL